MIAPPILPLPPGEQSVPCEWKDELPGEPCGDDGDPLPATHFFESEQDDGNYPELKIRWTERWRICSQHAAFLAELGKAGERNLARMVSGPPPTAKGCGRRPDASAKACGYDGHWCGCAMDGGA